MPADPILDELSHLRARLARLEADRHRRRRLARLVPWALTCIFAAALPLSILAANPVFSDLGDAGENHRNDIQALGNVGITTGFDDPTASNPDIRLYDPKGAVTREQMASFLARTAGLGDNPPIVNALSAVTAQTATSASTATNANTVGGLAPNAITRMTNAKSFIGIPSGFSPANLVTVTIEAPTAGFVLLLGTVAVESSGGPGCTCQYVIDLTDGTTITPQVGGLLPASSTRNAVSPSAVFPVAAGTHSYTMRGSRITGTADLTNANSLTAIFVPFDGTGQPPNLP